VRSGSDMGLRSHPEVETFAGWLSSCATALDDDQAMPEALWLGTRPQISSIVMPVFYDAAGPAARVFPRGTFRAGLSAWDGRPDWHLACSRLTLCEVVWENIFFPPIPLKLVLQVLKDGTKLDVPAC